MKIKTKISLKGLGFEDYVERQKKYWLDQKKFFEMHEKGYAPLNFDYDEEKHARKMGKKLRKFFKNYEILFRRSAGGGYHFTIFKNGKQVFLPAKKVLKLRKKFGDCLGRLRCDLLRSEHGLPIGILFNHKSKFGKKFKWAGAWRSFS